MILLRKLVAFVVFVALLFFSCKKEKSFEDASPVTVRQQWAFGQGDKSFAGTMDSAAIGTIGIGTSLSMSGTSQDGKGQIILQLLTVGNIRTGDYKNPQILFQYSENGVLLYENSSDPANDFTLSITAIDSNSVTGIFSGMVADASGNLQTVTGGKFTAALTISTNDLEKQMGQLTLWSKELCSIGGTIQVAVGDTMATITTALTAAPQCGVSGAATLTLRAGSYDLKAVCGSDTVMYSVTVTPGTCTVQEVSFGPKDYFPLGNSWIYGNTDDYVNDVLTISSSADTTINGKIYTIFINSRSGETSYYRKENGIYYQYLISVSGNDLTTPVELKILREDSMYWESEPYEMDLSSSGISFKWTVKLKSRISQANFSEIINGKSYHNLIEVETDLYPMDSSGEYPAATSTTYTIFSKGIGIVSYEDISGSTDWGLNSYDVIP